MKGLSNMSNNIENNITITFVITAILSNIATFGAMLFYGFKPTEANEALTFVILVSLVNLIAILLVSTWKSK
jgi:hypothetical protein